MSLKGEAHKVSGEIRRAIRNIAKSAVVNGNGTVHGTDKIFGYVCAIHSDGPLAGTVDVQEFNYDSEIDGAGSGHHKGVLLSSIQDNNSGLLIVPMMYSEVVIVQNPTDNCEYVIMYSHAQRIQLNARSIEGKNDGSVTIGVTEVEPFVESDDGLEKDYDELAPTMNQTSTTYTSASVTTNVKSASDNVGYTEETTAAGKTISIGCVKITINGDDVIIESDSATVNARTCTITGGTLNVTGTSNTDLNGPFNAISVCPFSGAPHCGSSVSGT